MLTHIDRTTRVMPSACAVDIACDCLRLLNDVDDHRAVLAQKEAKNLVQVPGSAWAEPAETCRTWVCDFTRAVPHGSFF